MRFWPRTFSRSPKARRLQTPPSPKPPSIVGTDTMNKASATCISISAYHDQYAEILGPLFAEPRMRSPVTIPKPLHSLIPSPFFNSPASQSSSFWDSDSTRTTTSKDIKTPPSRAGDSPSLHSLDNVLGDAPAFPPIQWNAYDVTSVENAVKLLQRVANHHDVDRFVLGVRIWLKSLSRLDNANATARIRKAAIERFLRVWKLSREQPLGKPIEKPLTFSDDIEAGLAAAQLLGLLFRAQVLESTDIAFAAEHLFKNRHQVGNLRAMHELLRTSGMKTCRRTALERIMALAEGLKAMKNESDCPYEMKFYVDEIIRLIDHFKSMLVFRTLSPVKTRHDSRMIRLDIL